MIIKSKWSVSTCWFLCTALLCLVLSGCTTNEPQLTTANREEIEDNSTLLNQLTELEKENQQLKGQLAEIEGGLGFSSGQSDYEEEVFLSWSNEYPHLVKLTEQQQWDEVVLSSEYGEVVVDDPRLIEYFSYITVVQLSDQSFPGGNYPYTDEPFNVRLTNSEGSYTLNSSAQSYVNVEDDYYYLFEVSFELANVGKSLLPRPYYLPEESFESRMMNSGGIIVVYDDDHYYYDFYQSKQRSITRQFLESERELISEREVISSDPVVEIIYLLHGEQILFSLFEGYVKISDNDGEVFWYKTDTDLHNQISGILSAG